MFATLHSVASAIKKFVIVNYVSVWSITNDRNLRSQFKASLLQKFVTYDCKSFITLATVIAIVNYGRKTFTVQATDFNPLKVHLHLRILHTISH
jgi:hypothetical protein